MPSILLLQYSTVLQYLLVRARGGDRCTRSYSYEYRHLVVPFAMEDVR